MKLLKGIETREWWIESAYYCPEKNAGWKFYRAWDGPTEILMSNFELHHAIDATYVKRLERMLEKAIEQRDRWLANSSSDMIEASIMNDELRAIAEEK